MVVGAVLFDALILQSYKLFLIDIVVTVLSVLIVGLIVYEEYKKLDSKGDKKHYLKDN